MRSYIIYPHIAFYYTNSFIHMFKIIISCVLVLQPAVKLQSCANENDYYCVVFMQCFTSMFCKIINKIK